MGPLPDKWWVHRPIDALTCVIAFYEIFHFDLKNRGIFIFWAPPVHSMGWENFWRHKPWSHFTPNYNYHRYHVGWLIGRICNKVEKIWKRL